MADVVLTIGSDDDELRKDLKKISKILERFQRRQAGKANKKTKDRVKDERKITREAISEQKKRDANDRRLSRKRARARLKQIKARIRAEKAADKEIERNRRRMQRGAARAKASGGRRRGGGFGRAAGGVFGALSRLDIAGIGEELFAFERRIVQFGETARIGLENELLLKDAIEKTSLATGRSQNELLDFAQSVFDTGGGVKLATDNLEAMGKAIVAFSLDATASGKLVSAISDKFGLTNAQTGRAINIIAAQAEAGSISTEDFGRIAPKLFGGAASAGLTGVQGLAEVGALAQFAAKFSGSPAEATTAVNRLLDNLGKKTDKIFRQFGVRTAVGGELLPVIPTIKAIIKSGASTAAIKDIFGPRGARAILPIRKEFQEEGSFKTLDSIIQAGVSASGNAERIFQRISETASFKFDQLGALVKALTARAFTSGLTELITGFTKFLSDEEKVKQFLRDAQDIGDAFLGLAEILNSITPSLKKTISFIKTFFTFGFGEEDKKQMARLRAQSPSIFTGKVRGNATSSATTNVTNIKVPRDRLLNDSKTVRVQNVNGTGSINRSRSNGRISAGR